MIQYEKNSVLKRFNMMKKWFLIALMVITIVPLLFGCGGVENDVQHTVTGFFKARDNQQYSKCLDYLSTQLRDSVGESQIINNLRDSTYFPLNAKLHGTGTPKVDGKTATVWVDIKYREKVSSAIYTVISKQIYLIEESTGWKIDKITN